MNKLTGFFRGKVVKRSPSKHGKLKIYIPGIYPADGETNWKILPDAEPAMPLFAGCYNGNGMFSYPNIGTFVWCFFINGDQNLPVYFAATYGGEVAAGQFSTCEQLPDQDDGAYLHKICAGNSTILISEMGCIKIITQKINSNNELKQVKIDLDQSGNLKIKADTSIQIETNELSINAKDKFIVNSPDIELITNNSGIEQNKFVVKSDSMLHDCSNGFHTMKSRINGSRLV